MSASRTPELRRLRVSRATFNEIALLLVSAGHERRCHAPLHHERAARGDITRTVEDGRLTHINLPPLRLEPAR